MNLRTSILKITAILVVIFSFAACEDDFETIGSNIIGEPGFNADIYDDALITAITNDLAPVQTNSLPINLLGVYKDPLYGIQEASVLSQVYLSTSNPDFGNSPELDSVVLTIPYFSSEVESDEDDDQAVVYQLDSVYGKGAIELSVLESNYFLNSYNPDDDFQSGAKYYSNLEPLILANASPEVLFYEEEFRPSASSVTEYPREEDGEIADTLTLEPRFRLHLNTEFFQTKILDKQGSAELSSQNNFRNYFRGIYILAEETGEEGLMMLLDLVQAEAGITLYYRSQVADAGDRDDDGDLTEMVEAHDSYRINFGPIRVNTFDQEVPDFADDTNLYLKGGEGAMGIINLFSGPDADADGVPDELEFLRESEWLINEAHLEFFANQEMVAGSTEPERLYLYNLDDNSVLADWVLPSPSEQDPLASNRNDDHLRPLQRDEDGNGISYRIRITEHINNVINKDSANVRLGLVVAQNVNLVTTSAVLQTEDTNVEKIPTTSVISPEGTVLYGPDAEDADLRPVLRIYYTEPKE